MFVSNKYIPVGTVPRLSTYFQKIFIIGKRFPEILYVNQNTQEGTGTRQIPTYPSKCNMFRTSENIQKKLCKYVTNGKFLFYYAKFTQVGQVVTRYRTYLVRVRLPVPYGTSGAMYWRVPVNVSVLGQMPARRLLVPKSEILTTPLYVFTSTLSPCTTHILSDLCYRYGKQVHVTSKGRFPVYWPSR